MLHNDELDLCFVDAFASNTYTDLCTQIICTEELGVIVSSLNPLAQQPSISVEELRKERILISGRLMRPPSPLHQQHYCQHAL